MKKRIAALLCAALLVCQLAASPAQAVESVHFTAINDICIFCCFIYFSIYFCTAKTNLPAVEFTLPRVYFKNGLCQGRGR